MGQQSRGVIHVSYQDPNHLEGGQGVAVFNLIKEQVHLGHETVWMSPCVKYETPGEELWLDGKLRVIKLKCMEAPVPSLFATSEASQQARETFGDAFVALIRARFQPDDYDVHLHGFVEVPRRARSLRNAGYDVTSTFHMFLTPRSKAFGETQPFLPRLRQIEQEAIHANSRIIVNSTKMAQELRELTPDYVGELWIIPNGVEAVDLSLTTSGKDDMPLVVTYGRISPEKGYEHFIEAAKLITENRQRVGKGPVQFLVFGKLDSSQRARQVYAQELQQLAAAHTNIVLDFSAEGIWGERRLHYLDRSTIGVVPSSYEPFGLVLIEMMARGLPVISTLTHGAHDILAAREPGRTDYGWVTQLKDSRAMADALEWLLDHPEETRAMGEAGKRQIEQQYTWNSIAPRMLEVNKGPKNIAGGTVIESLDIHPSLDRAAQEGRMFAIRLDQVDSLDTVDDEQLTHLIGANLYSLASPGHTEEKLRMRLSDREFTNHLVHGIRLIASTLQSTSYPLTRESRIVVIEEADQPLLIYKAPGTSVFAHVGRGVKTDTPYTSFYLSYHALLFALTQGREADLVSAIRYMVGQLHEDPRVASSRLHEAVFFLGNNDPRVAVSRGHSAGLTEALQRVVVDGLPGNAHIKGNRLHQAILAQRAGDQLCDETEPLPGFFKADRSPFLELHLTNACNLRCEWCTYFDILGFKPEEHSLPFHALDRVASLHPEEILLVGGGESTMYRQGGKTFNDAILRLRELLPDVKLRLITNGVVIPTGRWRHEVDEVSVSLDDATADAFQQHKGSPTFHRVWNNIGAYLKDSTIPRVRVTMVYNRDNLDQALDLARNLWQMWKALVERGEVYPVKASNFRFLLFPMADDTSAANPYAATRLSIPMQHEWASTLARLQKQTPEFWRFIDAHTNLGARVFDELLVPPSPRCWSNANYILMGADSVYYPCFAMCGAARQYNLGSIDQPLTELVDKRRQHFNTPPDRCHEGCRPHTVFYGLRAIRRLTDTFIDYVLQVWDQRVNLPLEARVAQEGIETVALDPHLHEAEGIVWFPGQLGYKILDQLETNGEPVVIHGTPRMLLTGQAYIVQYNESRGIPRRPNEGAGSGAGNRKPCDFCNLMQSQEAPTYILADLDAHFGVPYDLVADSRPFFDRHMLALAKTHSGGRVTYSGFRDLIWILNVVFPGMRGNIGTGNQEAHLHTHIYDIQFPIENFPVHTITEGKTYRIGRLERPADGPDADLAYFVVESGNVDILARHAYWLAKELENRGLMLNIILAPNRVYIMPQVKKTIGPDYPEIFDAFKDPEYRQTTERQRYVGPVEMAGIWLCYSRGNIPAMIQMYEAVTIDVYRKILSDTGLHSGSLLYKTEIEPVVRALGQEQPYLISCYDPRAAEPELAGGKGRNLHLLTEYSESLKEADRTIQQAPSELLHMPDGYLLTTALFDELVLHRTDVVSRLEVLDALSQRFRKAAKEERESLETLICAVYEALQDDIRTVQFAGRIQDSLRALFELLGRDVAVRSSANVEDGTQRAASGRAESFLHITSEAALWDAIRGVWTSLYSDRFVWYRIEHDLAHVDSKMAVIIQKMVPATVSGIMLSVTHEGRPGFSINANFGLGPSVADGLGSADQWFVGPDGSTILEAHIKDKQQRTELLADGGVQDLVVADGEHPCMSDVQVLEVARLGKYIRDYYRANGFANHVDVEFAMSEDECCFITQARPVTTASANLGKVSVVTVDESQVLAGMRRFRFDQAAVAMEGTATGILQVLGHEQFDRVRAGVILVTANTNNRWDSVFHKLVGVITSEGNDACHAASTAREYGMPCLVGAENALADLGPFDGQIVTLDARTKTIYIGEVPTSTLEIDRNIWVDDEEPIKFVASKSTESDHQSDAGTYEPSPERLSRSARVHKNFEGDWIAIPPIRYGYFQLEIYRWAWQRLPEILLDKCPSECPHAEALARLTEDVVIRERMVWSKTTDTAISPTEAFLNGLHLGDFETLVKARWDAFRALEEDLGNLQEITRANALQVVTGLVELLAWLHLARPFSNIVAARFASPQLQYVVQRIRPIFEREAARAASEQRQSLDRQRDKAVYALAEWIRSDRAANSVFITENDDHSILDALLKANPEIYTRIEGLSGLYKNGTEDIRVPSDSERYVHDLTEMVTQNKSMEMTQVVECVLDYLNTNPQGLQAKRIQLREPELFLLLRGCARGFFDMPEVSLERLEQAIPDVLQDVERRIQEVSPPSVVEAVKDALGKYPRLHRSLLLIFQATRLREYGHHLATRLQRKVAFLMRRVAPRYAGILGDPENIFDLGPEEFVALLQDPNPGYIRDSFAWKQRLEAAEEELEQAWHSDPQTAVARYYSAVHEVLRILKRQLESAGYAGVQQYFLSQISLLAIRVERLRLLAQGVQPLEAGSHDEQEKVDVLVKNGEVIRVVGPIERTIAHRVGLFHGTSNAFVFTPDGQLILQRRAHNKEEALTLSVYGGHVRAGSTWQETIQTELMEELSLEHLDGRLFRIGNEGEWDYSSDTNNEFRAVYLYVLSDRECQRVRAMQEELQRQCAIRTRAEYELWLESEQQRGIGTGEVWGVHVVSLSELLAAQGALELETTFRDGTVVERVEFSTDLLAPLLANERFMTAFRGELHEVFGGTTGAIYDTTRLQPPDHGE